MYLLKLLDGNEGCGTFETPILVSESKEKIIKFLKTLPFIVISENGYIEVELETDMNYTADINGDKITFYICSDSSIAIEEIPVL